MACANRCDTGAQHAKLSRNHSRVRKATLAHGLWLIVHKFITYLTSTNMTGQSRIPDVRKAPAGRRLKGREPKSYAACNAHGEKRTEASLGSSALQCNMSLSFLPFGFLVPYRRFSLSAYSRYPRQSGIRNQDQGCTPRRRYPASLFLAGMLSRHP